MIFHIESCQNFDVFRDVSLPAESENLKGSLSSVSEVQSNPSYDFKQRSSLSKWNANEELSSASSTVTESNQVSDLGVDSIVCACVLLICSYGDD